MTAPEPQHSSGSKPIFANRVRDFANRIRALPGRRVYLSVSAAAILFATASGAFGTGDMPALLRLAFWLLVIGFNTFAWVCWFAWRVRCPRDWWPAAALGAFVLNLPLPMEVALATALVGGDYPAEWPMIWFYAAILSLALVLVIAVVMPKRSPAVATDFAKGALWRAGARRPGDVSAISAEDHYCRIYLANGSNTLVHGRFADLVHELAGADGLTVRRGQWVAAHAVQSVQRKGRRWLVNLGGRSVPVASSCVRRLRLSGWIA